MNKFQWYFINFYKLILKHKYMDCKRKLVFDKSFSLEKRALETGIHLVRGQGLALVLVALAGPLPANLPCHS